ncbi:uncharacterized protein LOC117328238 isoform X2 [Pecten maximus]|uniref:uncharacterized protein LOC117328238 isoform X2 n=1 Tax=Pecten maximus TaxID=6579 RepID=UPI00145915DF|nr:uncharacterized protein LOC117328238 isoform X2 [Pecten maximus]
MERWNHNPVEQVSVSHSVNSTEVKPQREGEEHEETKLVARITSVENESSLEPLTLPPSCVLYSNNLNAMDWEECAECSLIRDSITQSPESTIFWNTIRKGPSEGGCHRKYIAHFMAALMDYADDPCLGEDKTIALLKQLLRVDKSDVTARVDYSHFARLVKYFGPIRRNDCVMIKQIHGIVQKSSIFTNKTRRETVSWFAGDMTREIAESLLHGQTNGTYLVRMSQTEPGCFAVSVMSRGIIQHFAIEVRLTSRRL